MRTFIATLGLAALVFAGCEKKPFVEDTSHDKDTKPLLAADLIGMDGQQLKNTADHMKAVTEKHNRELEKALEEAR